MKLEIDKNNNLVIDYELIKVFCNDDIGLEVYQEIKAFAFNDKENAFFILKVVMHLVETAEIFDSKPFRALEYVKSYLSNYIGFKAEYAAQLTDWIVRIINMRDDYQSSGMKLVVKELENVDYSNPDDSFNRDLSPIKTDSEFKNRRTEFFGVDYIDLEMSVKGIGVSHGILKSKKTIVKEFLKENGDEVARQLKNNHSFVESLIDQRASTDKLESNSNDNIKHMIENIARRRSRGKCSNDYQTIVDALSLYHENTDMFDYEIAEKAGVPPSTFNTWKKELDEKLV